MSRKHTYKRRTFNKKPKTSFKRELSKAEQAEQFVGYDTWAEMSATDKRNIIEMLVEPAKPIYLEAYRNRNYKKSPRDVWQGWNMSQREHFLKDHFSDYTTRLASVLEYDTLSSQPIGRDIQAKLAEHVQSGQYSRGGEIKKLDWRLGNGFPKYFYGYNNGSIYATQESNITANNQIKDIGLVFEVKINNFIDEKEKRSFKKEMQEIFPELNINEIRPLVEDESYFYIDESGTEYAEGGEVAEKYVISFKIDGKEKKKEFTDKDKMDSFLEMMKEDEPDFKYKVEDDKPKPEPKKSLFGMAKAAAPKAASKKEKESIQVDGISTEISRYEELKTIINNAKAEQELIGGNLKAKGVEAYLEAYKTKGYNPDTFNLADGDEKIMFIVMDKYKKVEPEKAAILEQFDGLLETTTTYSFNPTVLDRVGEIVSRIIMDSKLLSDDDKANLVIEETTMVVKKGTVDRLLSYDNPEEIFELVQPIIALK